MKDWFARISLFLLLVAVGAWWHHAAQSEYYGSIEQTWYLVGFLFVLAINVVNAVLDYRKRPKTLNDKAGQNRTYSVILLLMAASLAAVACRNTPSTAVSPDPEYLFPTPRMVTDSNGWEVVDTALVARR
ncbi:hypothetical protein [Hymenobacter metallilatus]|uniref:Uncharacterized protein n=1 Tax=Hymenobacter metallilatus TaxID=2493666 RepID=A0A3R9P792_9BACT|nr:hypothetical protein [Hymenobacter metallilatus]RSK29835.1 hypothetical protein EI290_15990 [Hymenobacter metallilatus]